MKKIIIALLLIPYLSIAQVGIGTSNPKATLDVNVNQGFTSGDLAGISFPQLTAAEINAITPNSPKVGTLVWATSTSGEINSIGYWYYKDITNNWEPLFNNNIINPAIGAIKHGMQTSDHSGWYILDGRSLTSMPAVAQAGASLVSITTNLPDVNDKYLKTSNGSDVIGSVFDGNVLIKENIPNYNITSSDISSDVNNHRHSIGWPSSSTHHTPGSVAGTGRDFVSNSLPTGYESHSHSGATVSTNGSSTPIQMEPNYLATTIFIYLGQ